MEGDGQMWQEIRIAEGEVQSEVIPTPCDELSVPPGKLRKADGGRFHGQNRPRFDLEDLGSAGCRIVLDEPAEEELVFQVKAEEEV